MLIPSTALTNYYILLLPIYSAMALALALIVISLLPFCANVLLLTLSVTPTRQHSLFLTLLPLATALLLEALTGVAKQHTGVYILLGNLLAAITAVLSCLIVAISYLLVPLTLAIFITTYHSEIIDAITTIQPIFSQPSVDTIVWGVTSCLSLWTRFVGRYALPNTGLSPRWHIAKSICLIYLAPIPEILFSWLLDQLTVLVCEPWKHTQFLAELVRSLLRLLYTIWTELGRGVMWLGWGKQSGETRSVLGLVLLTAYFFVDVKLTIARSVWSALIWVLSGI